MEVAVLVLDHGGRDRGECGGDGEGGGEGLVVGRVRGHHGSVGGGRGEVCDLDGAGVGR